MRVPNLHTAPKRHLIKTTILAKTTDYTLTILPDDYVPNQKP